MKRYKIIVGLCLFICLLAGCLATKKQDGFTKVAKYKSLKSFNGTGNDTLNYLRTSIVARKTVYIDKPLSALLNDLQLPIKHYMIGTSNKRGISPRLTLEFYQKNEIVLKQQNKVDPAVLVVQWKTPLPLSSVDSLLLKNKGIWTKDEKNYFEKQIVGDIDLINFNF